MSSKTSIGRYEIRRLLGQGGMGTVYLAWDPQMDREIALKTIRSDGPSGDAALLRERFLKEARLSGRLLHPNIATVFDVGEADGVLFLAMEYVEGESLADRLERVRNPLPIREALIFTTQVAEALAHAHSRGVVHRDIKPANILFTRQEVAKVTDFGIGKLIGAESTTLTGTGQLVGSPAYMSPEQIRSEAIDGRSDIFSLGSVVYQALTLKKPFAGDSLTALVFQILTNEPPDINLLRPDVPPDVAAAIKRAMAKNRDDRFADATEMAEEFRRLAATVKETRPATVVMAVNSEATVRLDPTAVTSPLPSPPAPRTKFPVPLAELPPREDRRLAWLFPALGVLLALVALGVGAVLLRGRFEGQPVASEPAVRVPEPTVALPPLPSPAVVAPVETPAPIRIVEMTPPAPTAALTSRSPVSGVGGRTETAATPRTAVTPNQAARSETPQLRVSTRKHVKVNVSPDQARVFVDGRFAGISDDWDDSRGGLLTFLSDGRHILRFAYPGHEDLVVEVIVSRNAEEDEVEIDQSLESGTPHGPAGPPGKLKTASYKTRGPVRFKVEPPDARVSVDGNVVGTVESFSGNPLRLDSMRVYEITLSADGFAPKSFRVLCSPSADDEATTVKEKLKPQR
jgi:predicted Ser/Thr protein kinase